MCCVQAKTDGLRKGSGGDFHPPGRLEHRLFLLEFSDSTLHPVPVFVNHSLEDAAVILVADLPPGVNVPNRETTDLQVMTKSGAVHGGEEGEGGSLP